jgi:hypothetical protein
VSVPASDDFVMTSTGLRVSPAMACIGPGERVGNEHGGDHRRDRSGGDHDHDVPTADRSAGTSDGTAEHDHPAGLACCRAA